ncbi:MAG TPA: hypothetical protein VHZ50_04905 [Puia sp.]|jgi:hypothetical protein|nr:hypothetical protein [Puia sp.]
MDSSLMLTSWQKGKALYLLLWMGAIIVTLVIIIAGNGDNSAITHLFKDQNLVSPEANTDETINQLLISVDELNISEKKSFINLYLKPSESDSTPTPIQISGDENVYRQIFHQRIERLQSKNHDEDFSVKPVPSK